MSVIDYAGVTQKQQQVWSLGDYGRIGSLLSWIGENLVHELDVHPGERVLDIAAGNGNCSLPAARRFADVLATDFVPELLVEAEQRAAVDGVALRTQVADAQALPFDDGAFDVVMSSIGVMFAPDQEAVGRELLRVCRPGGRIGLANWTPDSMVGEMFRIIGRRVPPPQGVRPPVMWGSETRVEELLGTGADLVRVRHTTCPWRYPSARAVLDYFRAWYGPTVAAFRAVGPEGTGALDAELLAMFEAADTADDGTFAADVEYLEVVAVKR